MAAKAQTEQSLTLNSVVDSLLKDSKPLPVDEIMPQKDGRRRQA